MTTLGPRCHHPCCSDLWRFSTGWSSNQPTPLLQPPVGPRRRQTWSRATSKNNKLGRGGRSKRKHWLEGINVFMVSHCISHYLVALIVHMCSCNWDLICFHRKCSNWTCQTRLATIDMLYASAYYQYLPECNIWHNCLFLTHILQSLQCKIVQ